MRMETALVAVVDELCRIYMESKECTLPRLVSFSVASLIITLGPLWPPFEETNTVPSLILVKKNPYYCMLIRFIYLYIYTWRSRRCNRCIDLVHKDWDRLNRLEHIQIESQQNGVTINAEILSAQDTLSVALHGVSLPSKEQIHNLGFFLGFWLLLEQ